MVLDVGEILAGRSIEEVPPAELLSMLIHRGHRARVEEVYVAGTRVVGRD